MEIVYVDKKYAELRYYATNRAPQLRMPLDCQMPKRIIALCEKVVNYCNSEEQKRPRRGAVKYNTEDDNLFIVMIPSVDSRRRHNFKKFNLVADERRDKPVSTEKVIELEKETENNVKYLEQLTSEALNGKKPV